MSSYQPLISGDVDEYTTTNLITLNGRTGLYLDADSNHSSLLIKTNDTSALYIDKYRNVGINTIGPTSQLDINSASNKHLRLTYNNSLENKADIGVSSDGKLQLTVGGSEVSIAAGTNLNIKSHDGSTVGLILANALVSATAANLNYNVAVAGTALPSKTLILNSNGGISGIDFLSATSLTGTIATSYQPNLTSVDTFDISGHNGVSGLSLDGVVVTATAESINNLNVTAGIALASKYLVLDENRNITNINSLTASTLTGVLQTGAQPNITSLGTLSGLNINGDLTGVSQLSVGTTEIDYSLVLNNSSGSEIRMHYDAATDLDNYVDMTVDSSGMLSIMPSSGDVNIVGHDGSTKGLKLDDVLVTATADQINYVGGLTEGTTDGGKALVIDSTRSISNINSLTATSLEGTQQTGSQPNIATVSVLDITTHDGSTVGLKLGGELLTVTADTLNARFGAGGVVNFADITVSDTVSLTNANGSTIGLKLGSTLVTATGDTLNYLNTEDIGTVVESKAVVVDANKDISTFRNLTATNLTGAIQTASQPLVTSFGTLTSLTTSGSLTVGSTGITESELTSIDGISTGFASESKALVVNSDKMISGLNVLSTNKFSLEPSQSTWKAGTGANIPNSSGYQGGAFVFSQQLQKVLYLSWRAPIYLTSYNQWDTTTVSVGHTGSSYLYWNRLSNLYYSFVDYVDVWDLRTSPNGTVWTNVPLGPSSPLRYRTYYHDGLGIVFKYCINSNIAPQMFTQLTYPELTHTDTITNLQGFSSYVIINFNVFKKWDGTSWVSISNPTYFFFAFDSCIYNEEEDRLYITNLPTNAFRCRVVDDVSTKTFSQIISTITYIYNPYSLPFTAASTSFTYVPTVGIVVAGTYNSYSTYCIIVKNKILTLSQIPGTSTSQNQLSKPLAFKFTATNKLVLISTDTFTPSPVTLYIGTSLTESEIVIGDTTLTETTFQPIDGATAGTVTASKLLIVDENKDIATLRNITATNLTGTLQTATQPNITSVGTLANIATSGSITVGSTIISESELQKIDEITLGVASSSKITTLDANNDILGLNNVNTASIAVNALTINSTQIGDLSVIDSTPGTVNGGKIVSVDSNKDISSFRNITAENLTGDLQTTDQPAITTLGTLTSLNTSSDITIGSTIISESDLSKIDSITDGVASANKVLVLNSDKDITDLNLVESNIVSIGGASESDLPVEVGFVNYEFTGDYAFMNSTSSLGRITAGSSAGNYSARFDGRVLCQGELQITSDRRLKKNIIELEPDFAHQFMKTTTPVKFNWKTEDATTDYGYIAQEISKAGFDDMISVVPHKGMEGSIDEDGFVNPQDAKLVFSPNKIIPLVALDQRCAFERIKKNNTRINNILNEIERLEYLIQ